VRLSADPAAIRFGDSRNHSGVMQKVRSAERSGLVVRPADSAADLRDWYRLYLRTVRAVGVLPRPRELFERILTTMQPRGMASLLLAEARGADKPRIVAGSLILSLGKTAFYAFNARDARHLALRPNDAIQWHAIRTAAVEGREWYDLGEADEGSTLEAFKKKWASHREQLVRYYHPAPALRSDHSSRNTGRRATAVWRRLPIVATAHIGELVGRRL
jgi:CelD/BcsL family acetyltransferase involved in cellulose biosynthesis